MDGMQSLAVGQRTYGRGRDGTMTVSEADGRAAIRQGVAVPAGAAGPTAHLTVGYTCPGCGRRNWFKRCGACGEES